MPDSSIQLSEGEQCRHFGWIGGPQLCRRVFGAPEIQHFADAMAIIGIELALLERALDGGRQTVVSEGSVAPFVGAEPDQRPVEPSREEFLVIERTEDNQDTGPSGTLPRGSQDVHRDTDGTSR